MSRGGRQWPPTDNDVFSGRGVSISQHAGNERFRALVLARYDADYCNKYTTVEKKAIAEEIVDHINSLDPPGRFLKRTPKDRNSKSGSKGEWREIPRTDAIKKTCQALRDCNRRDRTGYGANVLMSGNLPPDVAEVRQTHASVAGMARQQRPDKAAEPSKRKASSQEDMLDSLPTLEDLMTPRHSTTAASALQRAVPHPGMAEYIPSFQAIEEHSSSFKKQRHLHEVTPSTLHDSSVAAAAMGSSPDDLPSVFCDTPSFEPLSGFELESTFDDAKPQAFGDSTTRTSSFDDSKPRASSIGGLDVDEAYASLSAEPQDFGPPSPPYDPDQPSYHHHDT